MECRNGRWILTGTRFASGKEFTHLVCYKEAIVQNFADIPRSHTSRTCKLCSPIGNVPESGLCPPGFRCSRPSIESIIGSSNCGQSIIECPGPDLVVQLSSGLSAIVYPQDVYCDGSWIYHDGRRKHQVVNMLCLSKE
ncbi:unnamed protein product [Cylicocyclus nassatus]|uniref:Uncharacterized protein n=1 Tax=Cylicocyclus nassatus TaxID=53992 RepID=A0AA36GFA0_CYLNA|nr:unnamed protein product [Cylicocyclus nassatus]